MLLDIVDHLIRSYLKTKPDIVANIPHQCMGSGVDAPQAARRGLEYSDDLTRMVSIDT